MNHLTDHPNSPTQQREAPRLHWNRKVKAFQCKEFAVTVTYWLCTDHWDGRMHIEIMNCRVTWYDEDEGQPRGELVREITEDCLRDYYSEDKIIFE